MVKRMTFKTRLLLLWMGSLTLALALVGFVFVRLLTDLHEGQSKQAVREALTATQFQLGLARTDLARAAEAFAERPDVRASLHLIAEYQDVREYRPLVFDVEKARIAEELAKLGRAAKMSAALALGRDGDILAYYALGGADGYSAGFISYADGKPVPMRLTEAGPLEAPLPPILAPLARAERRGTASVAFQPAAGAVSAVATAPVRHGAAGAGEPALGFVRLAAALDESFFAGIVAETRIETRIVLAETALTAGWMAPLPSLVRQGSLDGETWWQPRDDMFVGGGWLPMENGERAYVLFEVPKNEVTAGIATFRAAALSGLGIIALIVGPLGLFFVHRTLSRPVARLKDSIRGLGTGRYTLPGKQGGEPPEIGDLFEALAAMAEAVERREGELRESRQRYRDLYEHAPVAYATVDAASWRILDGNRAFEALIGRPLAQLKRTPLTALFADTANGAVMAAAVLRRAGEGLDTDSVELRLPSPDGEARWVVVNARPDPDPEDGQGRETRVVMLDVTERREAQQSLMRSLDEMARINAELERFAQIAAHDLKEPVRQILTYAQLLERRLKPIESEEDLGEILDFVIDGARRMTELIEDLLAFAEAGRKTLPFEPVDMRAIIEDALANLRHAARESGADIAVTGEMPRLPGDKLQLTQLIQNLVANALKFMPPGRQPKIAVAVEKCGDEWLFSVSDNGIGIEENHLERIFDVFHRVHPRSAYPGTGVGLAICKRVVERHGGRIWVESTPGNGATFYFTLPAKAADETDGAPLQEQDSPV